MYFIVYNTLKLLAKDGVSAEVEPEDVSFTACRQVLNGYVMSVMGKAEKELRTLNHHRNILDAIEGCRLHKRFGRVEPRVKKRRPKPFRLMTKPRAEHRADLMGLAVYGTALT